MSSSDDPYQRCPICGRIFATLSELSLHVEEAHPEDANDIGGTASPETLNAGL